MAISRLPSHGLRFGSPPKLQGQDTVQLQLSATVAVMCQLGSAARGGAVSPTRTSAAATKAGRRIGAFYDANHRFAGYGHLAAGTGNNKVFAVKQIAGRKARRGTLSAWPRHFDVTTASVRSRPAATSRCDSGRTCRPAVPTRV